MKKVKKEPIPSVEPGGYQGLAELKFIQEGGSELPIAYLYDKLGNPAEVISVLKLAYTRVFKDAAHLPFLLSRPSSLAEAYFDLASSRRCYLLRDHRGHYPQYFYKIFLNGLSMIIPPVMQVSCDMSIVSSTYSITGAKILSLFERSNLENINQDLVAHKTMKILAGTPSELTDLLLDKI